MAVLESSAALPLTATLLVGAVPSADWDDFVGSFPDASIYLRSAWSLLVRDVFGHRAWFIEARNATGSLVGVLPVIQQCGVLGNFATSIPFFNYGGALARDPATALALMGRARVLADQSGCSYLELRDVALRDPAWQVRTDKVSMILQLPPSFDLLAKQLGSKLRSQVKRSDREGITVRVGGSELLDGFYTVFAQNMRDLGTPVYPRRFFAAILQSFPAETTVLVLEHNGVPSAAAFLVFDGTRAEIPWASCRAESKGVSLNMKLYWEVLKLCVERRCRAFDFGRSTHGSGTYRFKKQWGAQPLQLHWHRWERRASLAGSELFTQPVAQGRVVRMAAAVWKRLPLKVANVLGPLISPGLPW